MRTRIVFLLSLITLVVVSCSKDENLSASFRAMGEHSFVVKAYDIPQSLFETVMEEVKTESARLEGLLSSYVEDSDVSRLNREGRAEISQDTLSLLELAARISSDTEGAFDITVGPLLELWKFSEQQGRRPTEEERKQRLQSVDWRQIALSSRKTATLKQKNMSVDLGGIAKGYIADRAARILKKKGVRRGIVNAGGDLVLFNAVGEEPFKVGIKHPENPDERFAVVSLDSGAVVTSACANNVFRVGGQRICRIIDPRTGEPVTNLLSASIVAEEAATADALATAVMVLGREKGMELIRSHPGAEALLIWRADGKLAWELSPGLEGKVKVE